jgi:hypothetical protein
VYFFRKEIAARKAIAAQQKTQAHQTAVPGQFIKSGPVQASQKPVFEFTYSERYNLHRLPPEEAAAIRKKLEAEGH